MLQGMRGREHRAARLLRIATVDQYIARQPEQLAEQRHPFQALLGDTHRAMRHHSAQHKQIVVGLVVSEDHARARFVTQRVDIRLHVQPQYPHRRQPVEASTQATVVRIERPTDTQQHAQHTRDHKVQAHQQHT